MKENKCPICDKEIDQNRLRFKAKYCSRECGNEATKRKNGIKGMGLAPATTGAIGELVVASDLMKKGFHVFRAMSPSSPCDLAVLSPDYKKLLLVEVRTGYKTLTGKIYKNNHGPGHHDLFAVVINGGEEIIYDPPI